MAETSTSTLNEAKSPFLRHGAEQPVAWLPWGEAALERARRENKPILLDIGAVWCHWCHVMDRESYEDPSTAELINELFVPVKVDRDERPDVDARYQRAVQSLSGQAGWPLTAFLTPDGDVFFGGTYFPPQDMHGRPSFRRVLREISRVWHEDRARAQESASQLSAHLRSAQEGLRQAGELEPALIEKAVEAFADDFDFRNGGFGTAPKFPNTGALELLLDRWLDDGTEWARRIVVETLSAMARGGIYDQLGGAFHRYSVDRRWLVPHFEKMASDNGPLLELYARAAAALDHHAYPQTAQGIVRYYRDIAPALHASGGFVASQDADVSPDDDGLYWTWTEAELSEALQHDERLIAIARLRYGLDDAEASLHSDPDRHVLHSARSAEQIAEQLDPSESATIEDVLDQIARRLRAARNRRPRPYVDETIYVDWSAMLASGHIAAARFLGDADAGAAGLRALERLWRDGWQPGSGALHRVGDGASSGFLGDHAHLGRALLDAFEYTQRPEWLQRAAAVAAVLRDRFLAADGHGFLDRPRDEPAIGPLAEPHLPITDSPEPSGNAIAAVALLRFAALTGDAAPRELAERILAGFAGTAAKIASAAATYFRAVDWAVSPTCTVVVVGNSAASDHEPPVLLEREPLLAAALATPRARTIVRYFSPRTVATETLPAELRAMVSGDAPRAYVCAGRTCAAPVGDAVELQRTLREFRG
ncbi:MAG: thioredoxin domain-containing protein [Longimicrobiales bacterium]